MNLLKPAKSKMAYAKIGIQGFMGAGKTYTAADIAIGLYGVLREKVNEERPIAFLDSEPGLDFVLPKFKKAGIEVLEARTRSFKDLLEVTEESESAAAILIIDSITHFWNELREAFLSKMDKKRIDIQDWNVIKPMWRRFTALYVNTKLHIIMCGRAGDDYGYFIDSSGNKELEKTGTKMITEKETGFEPSLLIEMELVPNKEKKKTIRRAYVLKDRSDILDGNWFDNPKFEDFKPFIDFLNIGGEHLGVESERNSEDLFDNERSLDNIRYEELE